MEAIEEIFRSTDFSKGLPEIGMAITTKLSVKDLRTGEDGREGADDIKVSREVPQPKYSARSIRL